MRPILLLDFPTLNPRLHETCLSFSWHEMDDEKVVVEEEVVEGILEQQSPFGPTEFAQRRPCSFLNCRRELFSLFQAFQILNDDETSLF
jgi:hypothetical protein